MPQEDEVDERKLAELILYIALRSESDPDFGKTKLFKLLFYSDFGAYAQTGRAITGTEYRRHPYGPVSPQAMELMGRLAGEHALVIARRSHYGKEQLRPLALREPDLSLFTAQEIALVEQVLSEFRGWNATDMSDLSHHFAGWRSALLYEVIPYETALVDVSPPTEEEEEWLEELIRAGR